MTITATTRFPTSFDSMIRVSEVALKRVREQIFAMAEQECWYNQKDNNKECFIIDYLKLVYERAAEQHNDDIAEIEKHPNSVADIPKHICISKQCTYFAYHSGLYTREGNSLYVSVRYNEKEDAWNLENLCTEENCDYFYGDTPVPISFDEYCTQFFTEYEIHDDYLNDILADIEVELPKFLRLKMTKTVWETAKTQLKRDASRAVPVYRNGKMRFLVPLLYRRSDYVDMCIELTLQDDGEYEVTGYHTVSESYILARRMGPVRNYWLIKRSEVYGA